MSTETQKESTATSDASTKKTKRKLTPEEARARRKALAAKRRARILAGSGGADEDSNKNVRLKKIKGQATAEDLRKAEKQNPPTATDTNINTSSTSSSSTSTSSTDRNHTNGYTTQPQNSQSRSQNSQSQSQSQHQYMDGNNFNDNIRRHFGNSNRSPFGSNTNTNPNLNGPSRQEMAAIQAVFGAGMPGMGGMGGMPGMHGGLPNMSMPRIDPNADINDMMNGMFGGMFGNLFPGMNGNGPNGAQQTSEEILKRWKEEEKLKRYDSNSHNIFCLLFVTLLVFLPYEYEPTLFGYSLSSDAWTFFIAIEIIIFSIFYGYQQYLQGKNERSQQQTNNPMGMGGMGGQLISTMGAGFLGGGPAMSRKIKKWIDRGFMAWSYIKMLRQLISDLCLVLFLWIILTLIKTAIWGS